MYVPVVVSLINRLQRVQNDIERLYKQLPHDDPRLKRLKRIRIGLLDKLYARHVPLDRYIVQPDFIPLLASKPKRVPLPKKSGQSWPPAYGESGSR